MVTGIDHLVIAVHDLEQASGAYRALGFTVIPGGKHEPHVGTHNALIAFQDGSYVELIAFYVPQPSHRWWDALQMGGGLVDLCLASDDLAADARVLRDAGVMMGEPEPKKRMRPDGVEVRWSYALAVGSHRGVAPFVIQDVTARDVRVPAERKHDNGVIGIGTVTLAVDDVERLARWYEALLRRPGAPVRRDDVQGAGLRFDTGPHAIEVLAPLEGRGPLAEQIRARGASPYAATLVAPSGQPGPLDAARTLDARLTVVGAE
jgi:catechol 2,3-dioxygenase-like lactoylglutathione lyase family enzyme